MTGQQNLLGTHEFSDERRGFRAFITIDDLTLGPALGGIRMFPYRDRDEARADCERLAHAMTLKSAVVEVPYGGGKMVVVGNPETDKDDALYHFVADCIDALSGTYIAVGDLGWSLPDLAVLSGFTHRVVIHPTGAGDTAEMTAIGVIAGIQAVIEHFLGHFCEDYNTQGFWFALQGIGNVGRRVGVELHRRGVGQIVVCDEIPEKTQHFKHVCGHRSVQTVSAETIYDQYCDVFVPCARGGILTEEAIERLDNANFCAVAGSANNQLADPEGNMAQLLHEKGIVYAPDFVINAGGIIDCAEKNSRSYSKTRAQAKTLEIGPRLRDIFKRAEAAKRSPYFIAHADAERILAEARAQQEKPKNPPAPR